MPDEIEEIKKMIENHEKRVSALEEAIFVQKFEPKKKPEFKGLSGGIQHLISKGFLNTPKSVKEIQEELRKEGYHYPYESVNKILYVNFMTKQKLLTRIKENDVWKYVIRK